MFETCKQELSVGIGVVETVLFESQTGGSTFELVMATGGLSGGLSMRY